MTDLERVREIVQENCVLDSEHGDLTADGYEADRIIDAHLEKDADREAAWSSKAEDYIIELAELRADHEATYARLLEVRDDRDRLKSNLLALDTAAVKRYDELREAVRSYLDFEHGSVKHVREQRLRQLIEEKE